MKLLFVHDHPFFKDGNNVYSGGGLPQSVWKNYLHFFSTVVIYGRNSTNEKDKKILSSGDSRCEFVLTNRYSSIKDLFRNYSSIKEELGQQIAKADIVLVRLPSILGFIAAALTRRQKKIIVEQVGNAREAFSTHGSMLGRLFAPLLNSINKRIVATADYVIYVTQHKLQEDYPARTLKVAAISNVVIPEIMEEEKLVRGRFTDEILSIGLIGSFDVRYKGQDILLKAINILPDDIRPYIELYFVGKGDPTWVTMTARDLGLEKHIKYLGPKDAGEEIFAFLSSLSLYIQPSYTEGMPRALLEAMSRGCPVMGSDVGGIPDVVNNKYVHRAGDYKKIAAQIESLYRDRQELQEEAERSLKEIQPYLKSVLDKKRSSIFGAVVQELS